MSNLAAVLATALDAVEYGIVLLDKDLRATFINRTYCRMLALKPPPADSPYSFADLVEHARRNGAEYLGDGASQDNAEARIALIRAGGHPPTELRFADGRILKTQCVALPDGSRMLTFADISELVNAAEKLRVLATTDDLTQLPNRRHFLATLEEEFGRAYRTDSTLSVVMVDADHFKTINDRHGHFGGDEVLRALADRCRDVVRRPDILGRVGGEEFAAALVASDLPDALTTAERLRRQVSAEPFEVGGEKVRMTVSVGVAARRARHTTSGELLRMADRALYTAKASGRNRVTADPAR